MRDHCAIGNLAIPCITSGPLALLVFAVLMACVLSLLLFAVLIDRALATRHPQEYEHSRLDALSGYVFYVWQRRGRSLGDERLTELLDRCRLIQATAYGLIALVKLSFYVGLQSAIGRKQLRGRRPDAVHGRRLRQVRQSSS